MVQQMRIQILILGFIKKANYTKNWIAGHFVVEVLN